MKLEISALESHFVPSFIWSFGTKLAPKKTHYRDGIYENNCQIWNQHPYSLYTTFHFKQNTLKFWDQFCPKKGILGTEFKKTIVKFRIYTPEYSFVLSFILNKEFWSFDTISSQKKVLQDGILKKTILELKISSLEYPFAPSFILNKVRWSLRTKFAQKDILGTELKKTIVEFGISTCEYLFVRIFILNKALWSLWTKFAPKRYFKN